MSEQDELYTGADRGEFLVRRLVHADGVVQDANCRIRKASVFNFASEHAYALLGYQIEWWEKDALPPYKGGTATLFLPAGRPDFNTFYLRTKISNTDRMLYLEDAIITDFISTKSSINPMLLEDYTTIAKQQVDGIAIDRQVKGTGVMYRNCLHTTRFEASATQPLTVVETWMQYMAHLATSPINNQLRYIRNKPFTTLKDMIDSLVDDFT